MLDIYYWPTGNGKKITIMAEECGLEYNIIPVDIRKGDQHKPDFLRISPNGKMPAIVDHKAEGGPLAMFESGAILQYLAEKTGKFMPRDTRGKYEVLQWLFWQVGGLGPMGGQAHHFLKYADVKIDYAMDRFRNEVARLYKVMDERLQDWDYLAGAYSIADMAAWPWVYRYDWQGQDLDDYPKLKQWFDTIGLRPAVVKALTIGADWMSFDQPMTAEQKQTLFGTTSNQGSE